MGGGLGVKDMERIRETIELVKKLREAGFIPTPLSAQPPINPWPHTPPNGDTKRLQIGKDWIQNEKTY